MCGIAGVRRFDDEPITAEEIKVLLQSLERRGNHATGIALMVNGDIKICKAPKPAWSFVVEKDTRDFLEAFLPEASMALGHTRFATIGDPEENANNHPFYNGNCAIVHNGGIQNHNELFTSMKLQRHAETDSDIIRAILDDNEISEEGIDALGMMRGSAAIAAFSTKDPEKLLLGRSGSPLVYAVNKSKLWWASESQALHKAVRPFVNYHGLWAREKAPDIGYFSVPDHTLYILGATGMELRKEFKACPSYSAPHYACNVNYASKKESFARERRKKNETSSAQARLATVHRATVLPPLLPANTTPASRFGPTIPSISKQYGQCPNSECKVGNFILSSNPWSNHTCWSCKRSLRGLDN